jgi:hypothetical protein
MVRQIVCKSTDSLSRGIRSIAFPRLFTLG